MTVWTLTSWPAVCAVCCSINNNCSLSYQGPTCKSPITTLYCLMARSASHGTLSSKENIIYIYNLFCCWIELEVYLKAPYKLSNMLANSNWGWPTPAQTCWIKPPTNTVQGWFSTSRDDICWHGFMLGVNDEPSLQPNILGWQCVGTKLPVHTWLNMLASCLIPTCSTVCGGLQTV